MQQEQLTDIVGRFAYEGTVSEIKPLGEGLINDTYKVKTAEQDKPDYVLQRVNHVVFPDVDMVMRNIDAVTSHIRKKLAAEGVPVLDHRARRIRAEEDSKWDYIICMDEENMRHLRRILGAGGMGRVSKLMSWTGSSRDVADPWYTGDFDATYRDVVRGCEAMLEQFGER